MRSDVEVLAKSAGHEQRPAYYDELSGQFFFKQAEGDEPSPLPQATPAPSPLPQPPSLSERDAFDAAKAVGTEAAWEAFLRRFPSGFYADMALAARDKLARATPPATTAELAPAAPAPVSPEPPSGAALDAGMELNTDRPGLDYRSFDVRADPRICGTQCEAEQPCLAWTYVAPGIQGTYARCWLKTAVPQVRPSGCCISGLKRPGQARGGR